MDVFEYEVDELSDSEDLESNVSSGTDVRISYRNYQNFSIHQTVNFV